MSGVFVAGAGPFDMPELEFRRTEFVSPSLRLDTYQRAWSVWYQLWDTEAKDRQGFSTLICEGSDYSQIKLVIEYKKIGLEDA